MFDTFLHQEEFFRKHYGIKPPAADTGTSESNSTEPSVNPVAQSPAKTAEYWEECVFVGDYVLADILSGENPPPQDPVLASRELNTENISAYDTGSGTVSEILSGTHKNIYVMLGNHEIGAVPNEEIAQRVKTFLKEVKETAPDAVIYILPLPPVTAVRETTQITNALIDSYNVMLLGLADSEGYYYADINSALKTESGVLPDIYVNADMTTFKNSTKQIVLDYILTHTLA